MTTNTKPLQPEEPEYIYQPNELITFLKFQCGFKDRFKKFIVPSTEQNFLDSVYGSQDLVATRRGSRGSGGTTLLAFMAVYFALKDKNPTFIFKSSYIMPHVMDVFNHIKVLGYDLKLEKFRNHRSSIGLLFDGKYEVGGKISLEHVHSYEHGCRGRSFDYIFVDEPFNTQREYDYLIQGIAPCVISKGHIGKMIVNMM